MHRIHFPEDATGGVLYKKVILKILQNSQENTCARVYFSMKATSLASKFIFLPAVSLLPICSKIFKKLTFNELFAFLEKRNFLSKHQSGFRPGDSFIFQLLAITHDIFLNFDSTPSLESRGVFLNISKASDRVWHDGLLFKLKPNGISGNLL